MENKFQIGEVVSHKRYGYRGVIIGSDSACRASDEWHASNMTQPDRDQCWYHVLVDGASHTTYVAEENLEEDTSGKKITHPLLNRFFAAFYQGRYHQASLN